MIIDSSSLDLAIQTLKNNEPIVFPTETVYGLGANAYHTAAIERIFSIKNRPAFNPLIVHYASVNAIEADAIIPENLRPFLANNWPGPLTLIVKKKPSSRISSAVTAGLSTVAVRVPAHPIALDLLGQLDFPLAAPSANTSGFLSPTTADHVQDDLGDKVAFIVDGGACKIGIESTIIDVTHNSLKILRPGGRSFDQIAFESDLSSPSAISCPGQLEHHYSPRKPVRLNATTAHRHEGYIVFGPPPLHESPKVLQLSLNKNLEEAAHYLFEYLHILDKSTIERIAVMPIPFEGMGIAINDRLKRAAISAKGT